MAENARDPEATEKPRRRRTWPWILLGGLGVVLLLAVVAALRITAVASSRWREFQARQADLLTRVQAAGGTRDPVGGRPAEPGNAWDDYYPALAAIATLSETERQVVLDAAFAPVSGAAPPKGALPDPKVAREILARLRPHLDRIRDAGRRGEAVYAVDWLKGAALEIPCAAPARTAARLYALSSRDRWAAGDRDGALEDLEAGLQLELDMARSPLMIHYLVGTACSGVLLDEAWLVVRDPSITAEQAARLAAVLERTEAGLPWPADLMDPERALVNESMRQLVETGSLADLGLPAGMRALLWRQGFSFKIAAAEVDRRYEHATEVTRRAQELPWEEAAREYAGLEPKPENRDPIGDYLMLNHVNVDRAARTLRARLRLLRLALLRRAGKTIEVPADPFDAQPLGVREDEKGWSAWSRYTDGDQGGRGAWRLEDGRDPTDLVIEIPK